MYDEEEDICMPCLRCAIAYQVSVWGGGYMYDDDDEEKDICMMMRRIYVCLACDVL